ncbi:DUF2064 domain-containing protein [Terrabacter aeriphilus]|uniref:DUF2064 domain-containing protein n=1 Tax=Terrabacter aeriphilus TaxID=515662 RepID=A0ABP9JAA7_9MICO
MTTVAVVAKQCLPGRVKTRLCPPLTPEQAAHVAQAALDDTLATVRAVADDVVLYLDGDEAPASARGARVLAQCAGPLDVRLAHLLDACAGPLLLVGMDTPHLDPALLAAVVHAWPDEVDAWFGPATDGGFWALGLREPCGSFVRGVPMSRDTTGPQVRARLVAGGLVVGELPPLDDVDTVGDALRVAALAPATRFARALELALGTGVPA